MQACACPLGSRRRAKAQGADRFCMGAAWRELKDRDLPKVCDMIRQVKAEGMETCVTLGMLKDNQAKALADAIVQEAATRAAALGVLARHAATLVMAMHTTIAACRTRCRKGA